MKIKRFFSQDMRSAIRMVRDELGPDAVILSNNKVSGGIEVVAAIDYDESLFDTDNVYETQVGAQASESSESVEAVQFDLHQPQSPEASKAKSPSARPQQTIPTASRVQKSIPEPPVSPVAASKQQAPRIQEPRIQEPRIQESAPEFVYDDEEYDSEFETDEENWAYDLINPSVNHLQQNRRPQNKIDDAFKPAGGQSRSPYLKYKIGDNSTMEDWPVSVENDSLDMPIIDAESFSNFISEAKPKSKHFRSSPPRPITDRLKSRAAESLEQNPRPVRENAIPTPNQSIRPGLSESNSIPELTAFGTEKAGFQSSHGQANPDRHGVSGGIAKPGGTSIQARVTRQLTEMEVSQPIIDQVVGSIAPDADFHGAWQAALSTFARLIPISDDDLVAQGGIVALVGSTGVGKTTTIAKLAARYALRHGRENVALITTDNYRIGALEQLRTYGKILGIPVKIANNKRQMEENLRQIAHKKFVLIDTAGMSQRDSRLMEQFSLIKDCVSNVKNYLVMSTTTQGAALDEIIRTFSNINITGTILTKVDETTNLGCALSVVSKHKLPVTYISDGQKVPEDLHLARAHMLINRALVIARKMHQARVAQENTLGGGNNYASA